MLTWWGKVNAAIIHPMYLWKYSKNMLDILFRTVLLAGFWYVFLYAVVGEYIPQIHVVATLLSVISSSLNLGWGLLN